MTRFEWDPAKAATNIAKHHIDFDTASKVWNDPHLKLVFDRIEYGEFRWWAIGAVGGITLLVVVHTYPDETDEDLVRIISARKASPRERKRYEQDIDF